MHSLRTRPLHVEGSGSETASCTLIGTWSLHTPSLLFSLRFLYFLLLSASPPSSSRSPSQPLSLHIDSKAQKPRPNWGRLESAGEEKKSCICPSTSVLHWLQLTSNRPSSSDSSPLQWTIPAAKLGKGRPGCRGQASVCKRIKGVVCWQEWHPTHIWYCAEGTTRDFFQPAAGYIHWWDHALFLASGQGT